MPSSIMRSRLAFLLAATLLCAVAQATHSIAHGGFLHPRHLLRARTVDTDEVSFPGLEMFPNGTLSGLGLSTTCENTLYQTINCDGNVSSLVTGDYIGSFDNSTLTSLVCAESCEASISQMHDSVLANCGASAEYVTGMSYLALVDELWSGWNQSCFVDPTTGENCNGTYTSNHMCCTASHARVNY
jgi:hypothetical protein